MRTYIFFLLMFVSVAGYGWYLKQTYATLAQQAASSSQTVPADAGSASTVPTASTPATTEPQSVAVATPPPVTTPTPVVGVRPRLPAPKPKPKPVASAPAPAPASAPTVTPPSMPTGLDASVVEEDQVNISWNASKPGTNAISGYNIYRDGTLIGSSVDTYYADVGVSNPTSHTYVVRAVDTAGNLSGSTPSNLASASKTTSAPAASTPAASTPAASTPAASTPAASNPAPAASCTPAAAQTQTLTCPAGQTGSITQTRTSSCPGPTWSSWTTTSNTCTAPAAPPASSCGTGGACTAAQVAAHNSAADCWVYLSPINKVYNISSYLSGGSHPAGSSIIAPYCGQNMYAAFIQTAGGHAHSGYALNTVLQGYYIGPLQ